MKVARVTVTAMIHGLIAGLISARWGTGMEAAATLMEHLAALMHQETVRSHPISGKVELATNWSQAGFEGPKCAKANEPGRKSFARRRPSSIREGTTGRPYPTSCGRPVSKKAGSTGTSPVRRRWRPRLLTTPGEKLWTHGFM